MDEDINGPQQAQSTPTKTESYLDFKDCACSKHFVQFKEVLSSRDPDYLRGMDTLLREITLSKSYFFPFENESILKGKNLFLREAIFSLLE